MAIDEGGYIEVDAEAYVAFQKHYGITASYYAISPEWRTRFFGFQDAFGEVRRKVSVQPDELRSILEKALEDARYGNREYVYGVPGAATRLIESLRPYLRKTERESSPPDDCPVTLAQVWPGGEAEVEAFKAGDAPPDIERLIRSYTGCTFGESAKLEAALRPYFRLPERESGRLALLQEYYDASEYFAEIDDSSLLADDRSKYYELKKATMERFDKARAALTKTTSIEDEKAV